MSSDPVAAYVRLVRTAEALHAEVSRGLADEGLTASQFSTLKVLRLNGPLAQKDIATYLLKTGGNVTLVVDNLEKAGLVGRERVQGDRRITMVRITPAGEELFDRVYPPHLQRIAVAMSGLGNEDLSSLLALLNELYTTVADPICLPVRDAQVRRAG
ncbi:Transcriptional regulator, MarR family [Fimbriimonas ginsengisoli Gsoil 348]|uniref:Transcriptional regulator, MarR family n=1 Tax=Fimbriimonas ginsengisoli Gsoil 348 TaxID=661478 RepID=A0A068NN88_FIMGI|nr:Transcriptional regulator, MarR family [Fimbriimonas ginsengisoli Gsoil 348]